MAVEKTATKKTAAKKTAAKKTTAKTVKRSAVVKKGSKYACSECGKVVTIDTACRCAETCEIMCCGSPMKLKK